MYIIENEINKSRVKNLIRDFFYKKGFLELETPLLSPTTIPEHTISLFKTKLVGEFTQERNMYLLPSPELYMKKHLIEYQKSIFQICKSFRNAEQTSLYHKNEFTMLEYYIVDADYNDTIKLTYELLKYISKLNEKADNPLSKIATITSVDELLKNYTSFSLSQIHKREIQEEISKKFELSLPDNEPFDDTFNRIFISLIEPELVNYNEPVFIKDYPIEIECLAKEKNTLCRERFELYIKGVEIANGYSEMTDLEQIKRLFDKERKKIVQEQIIDIELTQNQLPKSSGVAIGLDRLIMTLFNINDINDINYN